MSEEIKKQDTYDYGSRTPVDISLDQLSDIQRERLIKSETFCMLPWIHLHGWPTGEAFLCCMSNTPVGNLRKDTMEDIWNNDNLKKVRQNMLNNKPCSECTRCYADEKHGLFSMRNSSNKHFGHHIADVEKTHEDGIHPEFKMRYWDVRFSNICNFRCRYCGPNFSSNWWEDKAALYGTDSIGHNKFLYAGKSKDDVWNQMLPHIPYLEQIYFAGGEPLIMDEHYRLLELLVEKGLTNVRLVYNTNFSELRYKKRDVLEYWKYFKDVNVGASLDAMGYRAEYMRKGTVWEEIEENRRRMIEVCPSVDFYISATVSVFNVFHIGDFHKDWVSKGLIKAQDFNINVLNGPAYYRCDILPKQLKQHAYNKLSEMVEWLSNKDTLTRATNGYKGLMNMLIDRDNSNLLGEFFKVTDELDKLRKEKFEDIFPEYGALRGSA